LDVAYCAVGIREQHLVGPLQFRPELVESLLQHVILVRPVGKLRQRLNELPGADSIESRPVELIEGWLELGVIDIEQDRRDAALAEAFDHPPPLEVTPR